MSSLAWTFELFKSCFFEEEEEDAPAVLKARAWSAHELIQVSTNEDLVNAIQKPGEILSIVFQDTDHEASILVTLKDFYEAGGLVVFFGIEGEFGKPLELAAFFGFPGSWKFSGYTSHEYEVTYDAMDYFGPSVMTQPYTKCNLLSVPIQDRWMVAKALPLYQYVADNAGSLSGHAPDTEWELEAKEAKAGYIQYCEDQYNQCPLAVHQNANGGRLAYLGFVNGDGGNIPKFVRSLVTKKTIPTYSMMKGWY